MTRSALPLFCALSLAACSSGKAPATDDFTSLASVDPKSDAFSKHMLTVGNLAYGETSADVAYHNPPKYRAFTFTGAKGDAVDAWVRSPDGSGDSVAWLLDAKFKTVASNDDADSTTLDSHLTTTLAKSGTFYVVFRDYSLADATFAVALSAKGKDFFACKVDSDCVAIPLAGCCDNGYKVAVNVNEVDAYDAANACTTPNPVCPLFVINDTRVAQCDFTTHACQMIDPTQIHCGGFINPSHSCPSGYSCKFSGVPDVGGTCVQSCDPTTLACEAYQHADLTACACVDNPSCGGFAGTACSDPNYPRCVDDPRDTCDPTNGGADCPGICEPGCVDNVFCMTGTHWDSVACTCVSNS